MSDHAALIERARKLGGHSRTTDAIMRRLADALEQSQRDLAFERLRSFDMEMDARAVVEAQALEQAVEFLATTPAVTIAGKGGAAELLRARAVEIREGQQ